MDTTTPKVKFRGTPIYMGGRTFILPPLSVAQWQEYEEAQKSLGSEPQSERDKTAAVIRLIHLALGRNYDPPPSEEDLLQLLDPATLRECADALRSLSGLTAVPPGE